MVAQKVLMVLILMESVVQLVWVPWIGFDCQL